jgi:hypothetical protein
MLVWIVIVDYDCAESRVALCAIETATALFCYRDVIVKNCTSRDKILVEMFSFCSMYEDERLLCFDDKARADSVHLTLSVLFNSHALSLHLRM